MSAETQLPTSGTLSEGEALSSSQSASAPNTSLQPQTYELPLPVGWLDPDAAKVLRRLQHCGYIAYLVGGCVRDLMVGRFPKDFDVGTSALPVEVKRAFSNCRLIGRRFRLAHILYGDKIIEVATFRRDPGSADPSEGNEEDEELMAFRPRRNRRTDAERRGTLIETPGVDDATEAEVRAEAELAAAEQAESELGDPDQDDVEQDEGVDARPLDEDGDDESDHEVSAGSAGGRGNDRSRGGPKQDLLIRSDNVFGTPQEDSLRRDFTINALFFDVAQNLLIDWVGGMQDLETRTIRTIGVPEVRFREDPVRMLRAVKFAASLRFSIEPRTWDALCMVSSDISRAAPPRVLEEMFRMLRGGAAGASFRLMALGGLLKRILPELDPMIEQEMAAELTGALPAEHVLQLPLPEELPPNRAKEVPLLVGHVLKYLWALDRIDQTGMPVQNHILLSSLCLPVVLKVSRLENEVAASEEIFEKAGYMLDELGTRLRVSRRDRERARLVLLGFIKLLWRAGRNSPLFSLSRKSYFNEALMLYGIHCLAVGRGLEELHRLSKKIQVTPELARLFDAVNRTLYPYRYNQPTAPQAPQAPSAPAEAAEDGDDDSSRRGRRRRRRRRGKGRGADGNGQNGSEGNGASGSDDSDDSDEDGDDDGGEG